MYFYSEEDIAKGSYVRPIVECIHAALAAALRIAADKGDLDHIEAIIKELRAQDARVQEFDEAAARYRKAAEIKKAEDAKMEGAKA